METLSGDLQLRVLRHLHSADRARCLCVSRAWASIERAPGFFASLDFAPTPGFSAGALAHLCLRAGAALTSLDVSPPDVGNKLSSREILEALRSAPALHTLRAWRLHDAEGSAWPGGGRVEFSHDEALELAAACPALRAVSIRVDVPLSSAADLCRALPFDDACFVCGCGHC